ncbi:MAG: MFS transporter [Proteobacteria bacterium]|nr:MFS transporter [Pseudomonadota bacterium]
MTVTTRHPEHAPARHIPVAILATVLFSTLGIGLFSFTLPLLSLDERVSGSWLGSAFAAYFLARLLAAPLAGRWADRSGPRSPLIFASLTACLAPLLSLLVPALPALYAAQILLGLAGGILKPVGLAALAASLPEESLPRWFARHTISFNIAVFLGPLLGGALYLNRSLSPVAWGLLVCMVLTLLTVLRFIPGNLRTASTSEQPQHAANRAGLAVLLVSITGRTLGIGALTAFYPMLLAQTLPANGLLLGLVFTVANLTACLALPPLSRLLARRDYQLTAAFGMLVSALALFALGHGLEYWHFLLAGALMGLGTAASIPASMTLATQLSADRGRVFGSAHMAAGLGFLLGPLLGGLAVQWSNEVPPALELAALAGMALTLPMLLRALGQRPWWSRAYTGLTTALAGLLLAGLLALTSLPGMDSPTQENTYLFTDTAMGTVVRLTLEARSRAEAGRAAKQTFALIRDLQLDLDHRNPEGSVGRINRAAGSDFIKPTALALGLIRRTLAFSQTTGGVFDPTIGALTTSPLYYVLDQSLAEAKAGLVDYRLVEVTPDGLVRLQKKGMALDLGGIAKGTIIDEAVTALRARHIRAGIVEAGGDFYCFGARDWTVGIQDPRGEGVLSTLTVREQAVCGSGDYRRYVLLQESGGPQRRHHIIDTANMHSATASIGVTVIAPSAEEADALATTLFIMGPDQGLAFLASHAPGSTAQWVAEDKGVVATDRFPQ